MLIKTIRKWKESVREKKNTTSSETAAETGEILNLYKKRRKLRRHWETQACDWLEMRHWNLSDALKKGAAEGNWYAKLCPSVAKCSLRN